jgi:hypothetical protein
MRRSREDLVVGAVLLARLDEQRVSILGLPIEHDPRVVAIRVELPLVVAATFAADDERPVSAVDAGPLELVPPNQLPTAGEARRGSCRRDRLARRCARQ